MRQSFFSEGWYVTENILLEALIWFCLIWDENMQPVLLLYWFNVQESAYIYAVSKMFPEKHKQLLSLILTF